MELIGDELFTGNAKQQKLDIEVNNDQDDGIFNMEIEKNRETIDIEVNDEEEKELIEDTESGKSGAYDKDRPIPIHTLFAHPTSNSFPATSSPCCVAKFEKVDFSYFLSAFTPIFAQTQAMNRSEKDGKVIIDNGDLNKAAHIIYDNIQIPQRPTRFSAGYDFFFPFGYVELQPGASVVVPTGIKVRFLKQFYMMKIYPKHELGFKFRLQLDDTVGIIDQAYYNSQSTGGQIFIKITNDSKAGETFSLDMGDPFCCGVIERYALSINDNLYLEG